MRFVSLVTAFYFGFCLTAIAETPLIEAVQRDDLALVERLLASGSEHSAASRYGVTPIEIACLYGHEAIIEQLLEAGADADATTKSGETLLMIAARVGKLKPVELLLKYGADVDKRVKNAPTALMWAAAEGHVDVVQRLVMAGADLHARLASGFDPLLLAVREGRLDVVEVLIAAGADVNRAVESNAKNARLPKAGAGSLSVAVENGHFELALRLVEAGADPNDQRSGFAPLHILSWVRKPDRGDDISGLPPPNGSGRVTSLEFARRLVASGAEVNLRLEKGKGTRGRVSQKGKTPFFMAADTADLPFMKLLVELGADPTITNEDGTTPLMVAAGLNTNAPAEEAGSEEESLQVVAYLLDMGSDINAVDKNGETAMHGAAYKNFPKMVKFLDQRGADIKVWNRPNEMKRTPLKIAEGFRPGNFRPSPDTIAALHQVMQRYGITPPPPSDRNAETNDPIYSSPKSTPSK